MYSLDFLLRGQRIKSARESFHKIIDCRGFLWTGGGRELNISLQVVKHFLFFSLLGRDLMCHRSSQCYVVQLSPGIWLGARLLLWCEWDIGYQFWSGPIIIINSH